MTIYFEQGKLGARSAAKRKDVIVIIDVLRASTTITTALSLGIKTVLVQATVEGARGWLGKENTFVAGERNGIKISDFDFGNSPLELIKHQTRLYQSNLVITTSNAAGCIVSAYEQNSIIFIGALVNLHSAVYKTLSCARKLGKNISFVITGRHDTLTPEDIFVALKMTGKIAKEEMVDCQFQEVEFWCKKNADKMKYLSSFDFRKRDCFICAEELFPLTESGINLAEIGYAKDVLFAAQENIYSITPYFKDGVLLA